MKIYVFNPEHDIALATNVDNFTAPHAGREIRHDLGYLPMLWAEEGEYVLVDDVESAQLSYRHLGLRPRGIFISSTDLSHLLSQVTDEVNIQPWGWDRSLVYALRKIGVENAYLPSAKQLQAIRELSHRAWAGEYLLEPLRAIVGTTGESLRLNGLADVLKYLQVHHRIVLKAPWSSSGRGVRYVAIGNVEAGNNVRSLPAELMGWLHNVISRQGCLMGEPYYDKVMDFGMELWSDGHGTVSYRGLSLFQTSAGAYTGNLIDSEKAKQERLSHYLDMDVFRRVQASIVEILGPALNGVYEGPLGIDMMVVSGDDGHTLLHPCVEMNLRCTMGHVALAIPHDEGCPTRVMRIGYTDKYRLTITNR